MANLSQMKINALILMPSIDATESRMFALGKPHTIKTLKNEIKTYLKKWATFKGSFQSTLKYILEQTRLQGHVPS